MSNHHLGLQRLCGSVDHSAELARDIGSLYMSDEYSDIRLNVSGQIFSAHKVVLAARSQYFRALLYGGLKETHTDEVTIREANLPAFTLLLKYTYTGILDLNSEQEEVILDVLGLSNQYGFLELESAICDYLKDTLCISNVCTIYDIASIYSLTTLITVCENFIDKNAQEVMLHSSFYMLSPNALKNIIKRDSFCAGEIQIFQSVEEWCNKNMQVADTDRKDILSLVRLPLISLNDLLNIVRPSGLLPADTILDAIKAKNEYPDSELQYRGYLMPGENVASSSKDAFVLKGEFKSNLLDGNIAMYDMDRGFTRHPIDDNSGQGILIQLGRQCIINHMRMLLWDKDHRAYSYYIEVSMDLKDFVKVIDHTKYHCRAWQSLHFKPRVVKYIRIVGTNNTINRVFHLVAFEAYYIKKEPPLHNGLVSPIENVALVAKSAKVIEGVSRARNNLLNEDCTHYDWDSGYTCHQLGSGAICVQLGQPYWLSSCRLLLWDCDDRCYSYYIEVSVNGKDWEVVIDKTRESCRSWQTLAFSPRPVVYVKIVGTSNTANEVFHCVHFECPAQSTGEKEKEVKLPSNQITLLGAVMDSSQPRGLDLSEAPMRSARTESNEEAEGRWMVAGDGPLPERNNEGEDQDVGGAGADARRLDEIIGL